MSRTRRRPRAVPRPPGTPRPGARTPSRPRHVCVDGFARKIVAERREPGIGLDRYPVLEQLREPGFLSDRCDEVELEARAGGRSRLQRAATVRRQAVGPEAYSVANRLRNGDRGGRCELEAVLGRKKERARAERSAQLLDKKGNSLRP